MCMECGQYPCHPRCPNAPEPTAVYECAYCNKAIREGEDFIEYDGEHYHEDCFSNKAPALAVEVECMTRVDAVEDDNTQIGVCHFCEEPVLKSEDHYKWRKYPKNPDENPDEVEYYAHHECLVDNAEYLLEDGTSRGTAEAEAYYPEYDPYDD